MSLWDLLFGEQAQDRPTVNPHPPMAQMPTQLPRQTVQAPPPEAQSYDPGWEGTKDWMYRNLTTEGRVRDAAEQAMNAPPPPTVSPHPEQVPRMPAPQAAAAAPPTQQGMYVPTPAGELPPQRMDMEGAPAPSPETTAASGPSSLADYMEQASALLGPRPQPQAWQNIAEGYAQKEMDRTKILAKLAFASGLASAGGGSWKSIGAGLASAGDVYDKGHKRYLTALQDAAKNEQTNAEATYGDKMQRLKLGADLYSSDAKLKYDQSQLNRKTWQEQIDGIDKMFGSEMKAAGDGLAGLDPTASQDIMERWQLSRQAGEYIPPIEDVRDQ